jgi:hypothetical protein
MLFGEWRSELPHDFRSCMIYEVVRGARITGHAAPSLADIQLDLDLRVDRMRSFSYRSTARADHAGRYSFTVPYSYVLGVPRHDCRLI